MNGPCTADLPRFNLVRSRTVRTALGDQIETRRTYLDGFVHEDITMSCPVEMPQGRVWPSAVLQ